MDILRYSAVKEQNDIVACRCSALGPLVSAAGGCVVAAGTGTWFLWKDRINTNVCPAMWYCGIQTPPATVNTTPGAPNSLCIVDTGSEYYAGGSCTWTVPANVTFARFQLWGAGASSGNGGCCCGGTPFGETGAYASVIVPVSQGQIFCLCAGCACYCYTCGTGNQTRSGCSCVSSSDGTFNLFAQGGCSNLGFWMQCVTSACWQGYNYASFACPQAGGCLCNNCTAYCTGNSCATCGKIPFLYGGACPGGSFSGRYSGTIVQGVRSIYPEMCYQSNHYGCMQHPPIYGFDTVSRCGLCWTSGTCCGYIYRAACNYMRFPGAGAHASIAMGGGRPLADIGRSGMVCVTWW